jgi:type II secretory pathway pseudopilin PulG
MIKKGLYNVEKQKGLTLIESLVVVGILLGIIAVALTLFGTVRDRLNVKNESENASFIFSQVVDLYSDEATSSITQPDAVTAGIFPKKMNIVGNNVTNSWGGKVEIFPGDDTGFSLLYEKVANGDVCVNFVKNQKKVGWDSVVIEEKTSDYVDITLYKSDASGSPTGTLLSDYANKDLINDCGKK